MFCFLCLSWKIFWLGIRLWVDHCFLSAPWFMMRNSLSFKLVYPYQYHFSLTNFTEKSFASRSLIMMHFGIDLFGLYYLTLVQHLDSVGSPKYVKFLIIPSKMLFFDILFSSLTHLLSSWGSDYMNSSSCYGPTGLWGSVHFFQSIFMFKLVNF